MSKAIEWIETVETQRNVRLLVDERPPPLASTAYAPGWRPATPDDLRRACEVVAGYQFADWEAVHAICDEHGVSRETMGLDAQMMRPALARERVRALVVKLSDEFLAAEKARAEKAEATLENMVDYVAHKLGVVNATTGDSAWQLICNYIEALQAATSKNEEDLVELRTKLAAAEASLSLRTQVGDITVVNSGDATRVDALHTRIRELEARLSALSAPVEGEPTEEKVLARWYAEAGTSDLAVAQFAIAHWRAGYAACAADRDAADACLTKPIEEVEADLRAAGVDLVALGESALEVVREAKARHQPTEPRATDAELAELLYDIMSSKNDEEKPRIERAASALAARVRAERAERPACLVERAVAHARDGLAGHEGDGDGLRITWDIVSEQWTIRVASRTRYGIETERVRATLEAMLTEVGA